MISNAVQLSDSSRKNPFHFHHGDEEAKRRRLTSYSGLDVFVYSPNPVDILRDICVKKDFPLPAFELIQQTGSYLEPEFTYQCTVSTIQRMGTAETKKIAKQKAAQEMITVCESFDNVSKFFWFYNLHSTPSAISITLKLSSS